MYKKFQLQNVSGMTPRQLRGHNEGILKERRLCITSGKVTGEERSLTKNAHCTKDISGFSQCVHPMVIAKISELVASGWSASRTQNASELRSTHYF